MLRIIDNKKVDLTDDEWTIYQKVVESYNTDTFDGKILFKNLFESDQNGIISYLIPPDGKYCSMEIIVFIHSIMLHQQLRLFRNQAKKDHDEFVKFLEDAKKSIKELVKK